MAHQILIKPVRILSAEESMVYLGGKENFKRLVSAGWVKPLRGKERGMDYDIKALDLAIDRVTLDGWPS